MTKSPSGWIRVGKSLADGASVSSKSASPGSTNSRARVGPELFPPERVVEVKALACELPAKLNLPLSRLNVADVTHYVRGSGLVASISESTIWRWLDEDAIRPWQHRCWIFPRDSHFAFKAGHLLDLYERLWEGHPLKADEFVLSADEKTSIQARARRHESLPPEPGSPMKVEHEYKRCWMSIA